MRHEGSLAPIVSPEVARHSPTHTLLRARRCEGPEGLDVALAGVPFDFTTYQRAGSRFGPSQLREFSRLLRAGHLASGIFPFDLCRIGDIGDAPVNLLDVEGTVDGIEAFFRRISEAGAMPLTIGGEHTITLPILRAIAPAFEQPLGIVQLDAHPDTIDNIDGHRINPATPFRRSVEEGLTDPKRHVMVGIRGTMYDTEAFEWARDQGMTILTMDDVEDLGPKATAAKVRELVGGGPIYVTVDLDGLDPTAVPGTNSPEPGGLTVRESQVILRGLRGLDVVGGDVNELCPPADPTGNSAIVAVNLMFEMLCLMAERCASAGADQARD